MRVQGGTAVSAKRVHPYPYLGHFHSDSPARRYWDETRDAGKFYKSDVLNPLTGFGGDGVGANGCIVDGPFANFTNNLGPGYRIGDSLNCINRFVNDAISVMAGQEYLDFCLKKKTYVDFWLCAENAPHRSGHGGVGGKVRAPMRYRASRKRHNAEMQ